MLVVCGLPDCSARRQLPIATGGIVYAGRPKWTPDDRGIVGIRVGPIPQVWVQPIDGSAPYQLTHFTDERAIANIAWSHDKRLAVARLTRTSDIVLVKGLR